MVKKRTIKDVFTASFTIKLILVITNFISFSVVMNESSFKGVLAYLGSLFIFYLGIYFIHSFLFYELAKKVKNRFTNRHIGNDLTLYELIDEKTILLSNILAIQYLLCDLVMILVNQRPILGQVFILFN
jgi:hypothetical protein